MKLKEIQAILNAKGLTGEENPELEVQSACSSDMMSDVLAFPKEHMVLLTGLVNPQVMRTADMLDIRMVVFVRGKQPAEEALELARECGISVLSTEHTLYNASGILFMHGLNNRVKG
ncbi:MAG: hypothetical protein IJN21_10085 [Clostridia bacterium]|nr:hypothetical protein [Clostridiales bacterium]MBQ6716855.1 hypothetical protein [Clostridia bacterium]